MKNKHRQRPQEQGVYEQIVSMEQVHNAQVFDSLLATERVAPIVKRRQSPKGKLGLSDLLDARRIEYAIPDELFAEQACFDRIFAFQVRLHNRDKAGDESKIILTQQGMQRELESAPYGIILSAGLPALDELRSNGIDVGHIVGFIREAPWRKPMAIIDGVEFYALLLRVGDITGSVDLATAIKNGECKVEMREYTSDDGTITREHVFVDSDGKTWNPTVPFIPVCQ